MRKNMTLWYFGRKSEHIDNILPRHNLSVTFKAQSIFSHLLYNAKDGTFALEKLGVYKL